MAVVMWVASTIVQPFLPAGALGDILLLITVGGGGVIAYTLLLLVLGMPEMRDVVDAVQARLAR